MSVTNYPTVVESIEIMTSVHICVIGCVSWDLSGTVIVGVQLEPGLAPSDAPNESVDSRCASVASKCERSAALKDRPITEGLVSLRLTRSRSRDHGLRNRLISSCVVELSP